MAGEDDNKTEEATEKKLRDAVDKGNIPVSREVATFASVVGVLIVAGFLLKEGAMRLAVPLQRLLDHPGGWTLESGSDATLLLGTVLSETFGFLLPPMATLALFGIAASMSQNAPRLTVERIMPDLSRVSPGQGWKRIFAMPGFVEFGKSTLKFIGVSFIIYMLLRAEQPTFMNSMFMEPSDLPGLILAMLVRILAAVVIATLMLAAADMLWARLKWRRDLRMTRQELKEEMKQAEGDPLIRAKLRSLALDRSRRRMMAAVPRATMVIANPTHYAIALRYMREEGGAPTVVAKGKDLIALKIREIAEKNGIPVVEDKALARSMYDKVEVDKMIPPELYRAVAEVVHFVYTKQRARVSA